MSSNSGTGLQSILPENLFTTVNEFITNNKTLDFLMNRGTSDIPYGFMAIATVAAGTFTYVTYQDYANEISTGISETLDTIQSTELFIPSAKQEEEPLFPTGEPEDDEIVNDDVVIAQEEPTNTEENVEKEPEPVIEEKKPTAPEESEKKEEEPGEKYKMGGKTKKRRQNKKKKTKSKRKS
jgi:outer membrane biosynthesis protein TonB